MCGIVGIVDTRHNKNYEDFSQIITAMRDSLVHRGPDDFGNWVDLESGIAFGHRRLSIIDISPTGRQPMMSSSERYVIVFNGEIYNHREIKLEIESKNGAITWKGQSDTEVLLEAISNWGVIETLSKIIGMFSFAIFDRHKKKLYLCRDRFGEKPLYYGWHKDCLVFASEIKAFKKIPGFNNDIDNNILQEYLRYGYIKSPNSIYKGIKKLEQGHFICLNITDIKSNDNFEEYKTKYWSPLEIAKKSIKNKLTLSDSELIEELDVLIRNSIKDQMIADVPIGAFLSGGIDSSLIVSIMQSMSNERIKTFTIGFDDVDYDESIYAEKIANLIGTNHTKILLSKKDVLSIIPNLSSLYDEPFSDSSQIPTCLLAKETRKHVTVSLSGDGGDELFCGYNRYKLAYDIWAKTGNLNANFKKIIFNFVNSIPNYLLNSLYLFTRQNIERYGRKGPVSHKIKKLSWLMTSNSQDELYSRITETVNNTNELLEKNIRNEIFVHYDNTQNADFNFYESMMLYDQSNYLPDNILVKLDRSAMGASLETRIPLLDPRIFEFSWRIPQDMKVRHGDAKWILRQLLEKYIPPKMFDRPKRGFSVPIRSWLREGLTDWAENLLDANTLRDDGIFQTEIIREKWEQHLSGKMNHEGLLWNILMFQSWNKN